MAIVSKSLAVSGGIMIDASEINVLSASVGGLKNDETSTAVGHRQCCSPYHAMFTRTFGERAFVLFDGHAERELAGHLGPQWQRGQIAVSELCDGRRWR